MGCLGCVRYVTCTHPDSGLGEVGPGRDLLSSGHVWVSVPGKCRLQFLQLLGGEVSPLASLSLLLLVVLCTALLRLHLDVRVVRVCGEIRQSMSTTCSQYIHKKIKNKINYTVLSSRLEICSVSIATRGSRRTAPKAGKVTCVCYTFS